MLKQLTSDFIYSSRQQTVALWYKSGPSIAFVNKVLLGAATFACILSGFACAFPWQSICVLEQMLTVLNILLGPLWKKLASLC